MNVLNRLWETFLRVFRMFFSSDMDVMSDDVKRIMSNKEDKEKYLKAIKELDESKKDRITVTFSDHHSLTLVK